MMNKLEILAINFMGDGTRSVYSLGVGCVNLDQAKFEVLCNEDVNFLSNYGGGYCANYLRSCGNQGWYKDEDWRDSDREWYEHTTQKERKGDKDRYVPPHECQTPKDSESGRTKDMLSHIVNKVEGSLLSLVG